MAMIIIRKNVDNKRRVSLNFLTSKALLSIGLSAYITLRSRCFCMCVLVCILYFYSSPTKRMYVSKRMSHSELT